MKMKKETNGWFFPRLIMFYLTFMVTIRDKVLCGFFSKKCISVQLVWMGADGREKSLS